jgi:peptidoglycan/LPS O-acetylase OafA/YrhL
MTKHIPAFDGLRGIAALLVVYHHAISYNFLPEQIDFEGVVGVSLFFTLSGFLMAFLYAKEPLTKRTAIDYAMSRFARIAPAYLLVIVVSWFVRENIDTNFTYDINNQNIVRHLLFSGSKAVFWSIPPEVQFYVFFIMIWWGAYRLRDGHYLPACIVAILSMGMLYFAKGLPGTTLPTKLPFFLFGSLSGFVVTHFRKKQFSPQKLLITQIVLIVTVMGYAFSLAKSGYGGDGTYNTWPYIIFCQVTVFAFALPGKHSDNIFGCRILSALGKLSFVIYLIHDACFYVGQKLVALGYVCNIVGFIIAILLTVVVSIVMHQYIERPSQRYLKWIARNSSLLARNTPKESAF